MRKRAMKKVSGLRRTRVRFEQDKLSG